MMNKKYLLLTGLAFMLRGTSLVSAAPLQDVPQGHWAAQSIRDTYQKKILIGKSDGKFHGDQPVKRYELALALDRFIHYIEAGRRPLHPSAAQTRVTLPLNANPSVRAALSHLSSGGFLLPGSPLFRGKGTEVVTAQQLSDAMAQVTIRLSDRSLPPNKE